jgi:hypothetical protein
MADGFADAGDFFSLRSRLHRPSAEAVIAQAILIYRSLRHRQGAGDREGGDIGFPVPTPNSPATCTVWNHLSAFDWKGRAVAAQPECCTSVEAQVRLGPLLVSYGRKS